MVSSTFHRKLQQHHHHHHHPRHLIISLAPVVNALLISIITHQFRPVTSQVAGADAIGQNGSLQTSNIVIGDEDGGGGWAEEARNATNMIIIPYDNSDKVEGNNDDDDEDEKDDVAIQIQTTLSTTTTTSRPPSSSPSNNPHISNHDYESSRTRPPPECTQQPRFSILTSENLLRSATVSYDEKRGEIWTFGRIYLVLECRASSPIDFGFDGHLINKLQSVETSRITYDDPRMPSCYSIAITIETNRESTGNYSCWSLREPILSTSLYIFAHGGTPPFLLHADIGSEIIEVDTDIRDMIVTIPCVVTNPNISVALYKIEREGFTFIPIGDYLDFEAKQGFLLQARKFPDPYGKYKCIAMNSTYYDVIVNVKPPTGNDHFFHDPIVQGRLEIVQDRLGTQSFICNASSQHPKIVTTSDCKTPIECRLARKCLSKNPYCSIPCRCSVRGDKCSKTLESNYAQIGFPIDFGCATIPTNLNGGIVQCSAVNFEPSAEVAYFIGLNGRIVQNWKNVATDELVQVSTLEQVHKDTVFFVGEWVEFRCIASRFIFSRGFQWKFQLANGTLIKAEVKALSSQVSEDGSFIAENRHVKISQPDIASVVCFAPVWNETGWMQSELSLSVKDSMPPTFLDPENVTITFYTNEKNNTIVCESEGFPTPDIMWFKDGEEYIDDLMLDRSVQNLTRSSVFLPEISLFDDSSVFMCNATNPKGTILKVFTLRVREESLKMTLTLGAATFIMLIGVFAIILWIFYTNRRSRFGQLYEFTDKDVQDFFNGNPDSIKKCGDGVTKAIHHPYDQSFEIPPDDLLIDYQSTLGQGEFGVVLRGKLQTKQGAQPVAVKTTKDSNTNQLRTLLSEIKMRAFVGKHENIVNLIGAVTKDLDKRDVYVVVEFCQFGNLQDYLRTHRGTFHDEFASSTSLTGNGCRSPPISYVRLECLVKTSDLIIWAYQTANALEYLASKKIVHGDVALRNVLLDGSQTAKITDFGLSKHIYTRANQYVANKDSQKEISLPWAWYAPETLKDQVYSVNSDVWSFGILLYELFSLAEIPYRGTIYNEEFLKLLANGFRLNRPAYANSEIYTTMRDCWRLDPKDRHNFTSLKQFFSQFIRMQHPPNQSELVQQMQLRHQQLSLRHSSIELDTESSDDLDKDESPPFTTFLPSMMSMLPTMPSSTFSTFGSVNSMASASSGHRSRGFAA